MLRIPATALLATASQNTVTTAAHLRHGENPGINSPAAEGCPCAKDAVSTRSRSTESEARMSAHDGARTQLSCLDELSQAPTARIYRHWRCSVVASGFHNGARCTPEDPHDGWPCAFVWQSHRWSDCSQCHQAPARHTVRISDVVTYEICDACLQTIDSPTQETQ